MSSTIQPKIACEFCKQAVSNTNFLDQVEEGNPQDFTDWKITIVFYCGLHYMKSYAKTKGVDLESHYDFDQKTIPHSEGPPELAIDGHIRTCYLRLRQFSYDARYNGYVSTKIHRKILKLTLRDSKEYLGKIKDWVIPELENANIETQYNL